MKELAKGKVKDLRLARMKVPYQVLDELERVSEDPRTDIRELLGSIQRLDLLEKLGVYLHEGDSIFVYGALLNENSSEIGDMLWYHCTPSCS